MEMLGKPTFTAPSSVGNQVESHSAAEASRQLNFKPTQAPSQQFGQHSQHLCQHSQHSQHLGPLGQHSQHGQQHSQHLGQLGELNFQPTHATSQLGLIDFGTNAESDDSGWVTIPIQRL